MYFLYCAAFLHIQDIHQSSHMSSAAGIESVDGGPIVHNKNRRTSTEVCGFVLG